MKIYLAPNWSCAKTFNSTYTQPDATVEAEYGTHILRGSKVTLAHHHEDYKHHPAPCLAETEPLPEYATIVISHIDLDTIGGIMQLMGRKPNDPSFWAAAAYIDLYGPHHLTKFPAEQDKLNAYWYWVSEESIVPKVNQTIEVTELILSHMDALDSILLEQNQHLIEGGKKWKEEVEEKVKNCLVSENEFMRIFKTKNVFCASSYYSTTRNQTIPVTITFHERKRDITLATCGNVFCADEVMQQLFGPEAGGKNTIAKTPRGKKMTLHDFEKTIETVTTLYENHFGLTPVKTDTSYLKTS